MSPYIGPHPKWLPVRVTLWKLLTLTGRHFVVKQVVGQGIIPPWQFAQYPHSSSADVLRVLHDSVLTQWETMGEFWMVSDDVNLHIRQRFGAPPATNYSLGVRTVRARHPMRPQRPETHQNGQKWPETGKTDQEGPARGQNDPETKIARTKIARKGPKGPGNHRNGQTIAPKRQKTTEKAGKLLKQPQSYRNSQETTAGASKPPKDPANHRSNRTRLHWYFFQVQKINLPAQFYTNP